MKITKIAVAALFAVAMLATGVQAESTFVQGSQKVFLRGAGCGATEDPYLSIKQGPDELDGCGGIGGLPFNEAFAALGPDPTTFGARDGLPLILDNSRDITMVITTETWLGAPTVGVGQSVVQVSLSGAQQGSFAAKSLGSATSERIVLASGQTAHSFTFNIPDAITTTPFTSISLDVSVRGANYNHSNLALEGDSHFTLPILIEQPA